MPEPERKRLPELSTPSFTVGVAFLYLFSIGPVFALAQRFHWNLAPLELLYAPLLWLAEYTALRRLFDIYFDLCGVK